MQRKTISHISHPAHGKAPSIRFAGHPANRPDTNLSRAELRRIVAEMLG